MKSIYAITPSGIDFKKLINEIEKMLSLGIKLFQYREKSLSEEQLKNNASILLEKIFDFCYCLVRDIEFLRFEFFYHDLF
jgi:thiamine monophosphate synthase